MASLMVIMMAAGYMSVMHLRQYGVQPRYV
jgi:hypothetical protein